MATRRLVSAHGEPSLQLVRRPGQIVDSINQPLEGVSRLLRASIGFSNLKWIALISFTELFFTKSLKVSENVWNSRPIPKQHRQKSRETDIQVEVRGKRAIQDRKANRDY